MGAPRWALDVRAWPTLELEDLVVLRGDFGREEVVDGKTQSTDWTLHRSQLWELPEQRS